MAHGDHVVWNDSSRPVLAKQAARLVAFWREENGRKSDDLKSFDAKGAALSAHLYFQLDIGSFSN
jgi:hypothetical protein